jgi:hypothetical protein
MTEEIAFGGPPSWIVDNHAPCSLPAHFTVLDQPATVQAMTGILSTDIQSHQQGCWCSCPILCAGQVFDEESKMPLSASYISTAARKMQLMTTDIQASPERYWTGLAFSASWADTGNKPIDFCHSLLGLGLEDLR